MDPPTMAIARVRTSGRVASASHAVTAAEIAPAPWIARPSVIHVRSVESAQTTLPATKSSRPAITTGRRPNRSEASPKGICMNAWVRPYMPRASPTRDGSSPPGRPLTATANTGSSRNNPSIRAANRLASAMLARRSVGLNDKVCFFDIGNQVLRSGDGPRNSSARYSTKFPFLS